MKGDGIDGLTAVAFVVFTIMSHTPLPVLTQLIVHSSECRCCEVPVDGMAVGKSSFCGHPSFLNWGTSLELL